MEEDKRISPRILFNSALCYHKKGRVGYCNTIGKDISNTGIGFISNEFIPKKTHLIFELHPPWQPAPLSTLAEVVWISNQPYSEKFEVGARFFSPLPKAL